MRSRFSGRQAEEQIFGVRERRARQLMAGLPCLQIGNAAAVTRADMIEPLKTTSTENRFQCEKRRRACVVESLETLRKHAEFKSLPSERT